MTDKVGIIYWCGGTGHAARSIPVAQEFESRSVEVSIAGGGFGAKFLELNGFDQPGLTEVDDPAEYTLWDFLPRIFTGLIPTSLMRIRDIRTWLKNEQPDKLVTDDLFAIILASIYGIEFYRIDHITPDLLPLKWRVLSRIYNYTSMIRGEEMIITSLWKEEEDPEGITKVGPLAQEGEAEEEVESYDVLLSPGSWGKNFEAIREELEDSGYKVRTVGDDEWELKPSMTPYTKATKVVICTGFSSIADTVVAGTPCIVYPFLPFQRAMTGAIEERELPGIETAGSIQEAVEKAEKYCEGGGQRPEYSNGAPELVERVLEE